MSGIRKIDPFNTHMLKHVYGILSTSNEACFFKNISWEKFLECRDSVYVHIDTSYDIYNPIIDCIIASRRTNLTDIDLNGLDYYCKPNDILYSIECLYISDHHDPEKISCIILQLVDLLCKDKNDAFICLKVKCDENKSHRYISKLIDYGFKYLECKSGLWIFTKAPTVNKNKPY